MTEASAVLFVCGFAIVLARFLILRSSCGVPFQIALASFYEDGGDEDILTLPQPAPSSISRGTAAR